MATVNIYIGGASPAVLRAAKAFESYYVQQQGDGGADMFSYLPGYGEQEGGGFGNVLWSWIKPLIFSAGKALGRQAVSTTAGYAADLATGANWKQAGKARLKEAGSALRSKFENKIGQMAGSGIKHKDAKINRLAAMLNRHRKRVPRNSLGLFTTAGPSKKKRKTSSKKKKGKGKTKRRRKSSRLARRQSGKGFHDAPF